MADVVFREKDNGALVEVTLGSKVTVELEENPTTGYQWRIDSVDEVFLVPEGDAFLVGEQMGLGAAGVRPGNHRQIQTRRPNFEIAR